MQNAHHFGDGLVFFSGRNRIGDAAFEVVLHNEIVRVFKCFLNGLGLVKNVDTILVALHHRKDFFQMPEGNLEPVQDSVLSIFWTVHEIMISPSGGYCQEGNLTRELYSSQFLGLLEVVFVTNYQNPTQTPG